MVATPQPRRVDAAPAPGPVRHLERGCPRSRPQPGPRPGGDGAARLGSLGRPARTGSTPAGPSRSSTGSATLDGLLGARRRARRSPLAVPGAAGPRGGAPPRPLGPRSEPDRAPRSPSPRSVAGRRPDYFPAGVDVDGDPSPRPASHEPGRDRRTRVEGFVTVCPARRTQAGRPGHPSAFRRIDDPTATLVVRRRRSGPAAPGEPRRRRPPDPLRRSGPRRRAGRGCTAMPGGAGHPAGRGLRLRDHRGHAARSAGHHHHRLGRTGGARSPTGGRAGGRARPGALGAALQQAAGRRPTWPSGSAGPARRSCPGPRLADGRRPACSSPTRPRPCAPGQTWPARRREHLPDRSTGPAVDPNVPPTCSGPCRPTAGRSTIVAFSARRARCRGHQRQPDRDGYEQIAVPPSERHRSAETPSATAHRQRRRSPTSRPRCCGRAARSSSGSCAGAARAPTRSSLVQPYLAPAVRGLDDQTARSCSTPTTTNGPSRRRCCPTTRPAAGCWTGWPRQRGPQPPAPLLVVTTTDEDARRSRPTTASAAGSMVVVPNGVDTGPGAAPPPRDRDAPTQRDSCSDRWMPHLRAARRVALFVGSAHRPNIDAARELVDTGSRAPRGPVRCWPGAHTDQLDSHEVAAQRPPAGSR